MFVTFKPPSALLSSSGDVSGQFDGPRIHSACKRKRGYRQDLLSAGLLSGSGKWGRCRLVFTLPPLGLTRNDTSMQSPVACCPPVVFVLLHEGRGGELRDPPGEKVMKALDLLPGKKHVHTKILTLKASHAPTPERVHHTSSSAVSGSVR